MRGAGQSGKDLNKHNAEHQLGQEWLRTGAAIDISQWLQIKSRDHASDSLDVPILFEVLLQLQQLGRADS